MEVMLERVRAGEDDPACLLCGGVVKSATISFGQSLVPEVIARALRTAEEADVLLAVGTSLKVYPVKNMIPRAMAAGAIDAPVRHRVGRSSHDRGGSGTAICAAGRP